MYHYQDCAAQPGIPMGTFHFPILLRVSFPKVRSLPEQRNCFLPHEGADYKLPIRQYFHLTVHPILVHWIRSAFVLCNPLWNLNDLWLCVSHRVEVFSRQLVAVTPPHPTSSLRGVPSSYPPIDRCTFASYHLILSSYNPGNIQVQETQVNIWNVGRIVGNHL